MLLLIWFSQITQWYLCICPHQDLLLLPQGPTTTAYVEFWVGELEGILRSRRH
jgi:uncharacterized protein Usg